MSSESQRLCQEFGANNLVRFRSSCSDGDAAIVSRVFDQAGDVRFANEEFTRTLGRRQRQRR